MSLPKKRKLKKPKERKNKPRILITGGLGFIFSHVTEYFVKKGWNVYVVDNLSVGSHPEIIDDSFSFYPIDINNLSPEFLQYLDPQYVVHAAANSDVDFSIENPMVSFNNNSFSTVRLLYLCRTLKNLKKFLYISTDEVYGECDHRKNETEIIFPRNPYSLSKAVGSIARLAFDNTYPELKDKTAEVRFCNIFGPRQDARKIIPAIKRALETQKPLPLHNNGEGYREWLYVKEVPPLIELVLLAGTRTYNITANAGYTVKILIELAESVTGKKVPITETERAGMDIAYEMDATRIRNELHWQPKYEFITAFEAYLKNKPL